MVGVVGRMASAAAAPAVFGVPVCPERVREAFSASVAKLAAVPLSRTWLENGPYVSMWLMHIHIKMVLDGCQCVQIHGSVSTYEATVNTKPSHTNTTEAMPRGLCL